MGHLIRPDDPFERCEEHDHVIRHYSCTRVSSDVVDDHVREIGDHLFRLANAADEAYAMLVDHPGPHPRVSTAATRERNELHALAALTTAARKAYTDLLNARAKANEYKHRTS